MCVYVGSFKVLITVMSLLALMSGADSLWNSDSSYKPMLNAFENPSLTTHLFE